MLSKIPMGRFVKVDEIAALACWLASEDCSFSTGGRVRHFRRKGHLLMKTKNGTGLRSIQWFGRQDIYGFIYRSWMKNRGVPQDQFDGRPVIGICNTWSELTPCNSHFRELAEHVQGAACWRPAAFRSSSR